MSVAEALGREAAAGGSLAAEHVRADALSTRYPDGRFGLAGVTLSVAPGERVALIGPNGAGKSTLLLSLVRLVEPTGGSATVLGTAVRSLGARGLRRLRSQVGFVFQRHNLVGRLSVLANVVHGAQSASASPLLWCAATAPPRVREAAIAELDAVGLADLADRRADRLSGGQSQRVAIARTMMQRPAVILADEPVASLDPKAAEDVMSLFRERVDAAGATFVFTSHILDHARRHADRLIALKAGRIAFDVPAHVATAAELAALYRDG